MSARFRQEYRPDLNGRNAALQSSADGGQLFTVVGAGTSDPVSVDFAELISRDYQTCLSFRAGWICSRSPGKDLILKLSKVSAGYVCFRHLAVTSYALQIKA